jgi:short-subunit dehydrogenase
MRNNSTDLAQCPSTYRKRQLGVGAGTTAEIRRQYETNVFGLMNVTRAFLPGMRERRAGRIINVSSIAGRITLPYYGAYSSTKYAVEALSDALRYRARGSASMSR